jgi:hypothetical protein
MDITNSAFRIDGEASLQAIVDAALERGDAVESASLELKGEIDVGKPAGVAKVAKFILGAWNRNPAVARDSFGGYAVMVIGIDGARRKAIGIPRGTESHDLANKLAKYLGQDDDPPGWDLQRLPLPPKADPDQSRELLFIIVDPPDLARGPRLCWSGGGSDSKEDALKNGAIYHRTTSQTTEANAATVDRMVKAVIRAATASEPVELQVTIDGCAYALPDFRDHYMRYVKQQAQAHRKPPKPQTSLEAAHWGSTRATWDMFHPHDHLPPGWEQEQLGKEQERRDLLLAAHGNGINVTVTNRHKQRYLEGVELELICHNTYAVYWQAPEDCSTIDVWPQPLKSAALISAQTRAALRAVHLPADLTRASRLQVENTENNNTAQIDIGPWNLGQEATQATGNEHVVLMATNPDADYIAIDWFATFKTNSPRVEGHTTIPVKPLPDSAPPTVF